MSKKGKVSVMSENLEASEIIKLAGEIKQKVAEGNSIYNFTIGDFDSKLFPIPDLLKSEIIHAYQNDFTNYPPANGVPSLRKAVSVYLKDKLDLDYSENNILIAGGSRPLIYATFQAIVDPGDTVVFPVPSWNNNHYTHLSRGKHVFVETTTENNFMPVADDFKHVIQDTTLIALCSPLNPTGTVFSKEQLVSICEMVVAENKRRNEDEKPLYVIYDQVYWQLTYGDTEHFNPVSLVPEMVDYTIFIDGISKAYAATGVRVGWAFGPTKVIDIMKSILGHMGAWSPKPEQEATAVFLSNMPANDAYLSWIKSELYDRLSAFYNAFAALKKEGLPIEVIKPQAAIYLTLKFDLIGKTTATGEVLHNTEAITQYILDEAKLAIVPFSAFGSSKESLWYRLSVGVTKKSEIGAVVETLKEALLKLE
jgi:aspartate aminotransferase